MKKSRARIVLFLMLFMMVFLNADQMVMSPNIGEIEAEFAITKADIGLIQGSFTIVGALVSLAWGFLADKYKSLDWNRCWGTLSGSFLLCGRYF